MTFIDQGDTSQMKRVLIAGANSYIGTFVEKRLSQEPEQYETDTLDLRDETWVEYGFSIFDSVVYVAGIVHKKETSKNRSQYFQVNRDLTYEVAKKAKTEGVSQFIFLSTMSVYGISIGEINRDSPLRPASAYGQSKLEAENLLRNLEDTAYTITILRPPMVYGAECKGNYSKLARLARITPVFPNVENQRSMLYIENLAEFIKKMIDNEAGGVFFPQNKEYVCTSTMVRFIAEAHGKRLKLSTLFNRLLETSNLELTTKLFGDLTYEKNLSSTNFEYEVCSFEESIFRSEMKN